MTVHVTPEGGGTVKVNGTTYDSFPAYITVADNSTVLFEAIPADEYEFVNWSGDLSGNENPTTDYVTCDITVTTNFQASNELPVANAGGNQTVVEGSTVTLDGSASYDPDGEITTYLWTQTGGAEVTLSYPTTVIPTFVTSPVDADGAELTFELAVTDEDGLQSTDEVSVMVSDNGINGFPTDVTTFKTSTGEEMGIKSGTGAHITYLETVSPDTIDDPEGQPDNLIYGLINLKVKVDTVGGTVEVTVYLPEVAPDDYRWHKYLPGSGWFDFSANAELNAERDQVVLTLTDGGAGDDDGVANGVITDPSGLGTGPEIPPDSGGGGCFISTVNP